MGLKERILSIDVVEDRKRSSVRGQAAQLAAEADALMEEMADTIELLRGCCTDMGADGEAAHTLHKYNQYKDQTND